MPSIIQGYTYDIFISYRQKDNKHDGWVTEFVNHLKGELESTFKEEISVYFDINPHDGLLETDDVDASLKEKLKCLIFIPVISRTYCDPKSFAWEHEFKAFIEQASQDQFGLKVTLPGGNVANRVLPVRIHGLDTGDIKLCESFLGSVLRGVEFIYKSPGVNRPLRPKENSSGDNLNKTFYRDQINKVALAIKEIILGLKAESKLPLKNKVSHGEQIEEVFEEDRRIDQEKSAKLTRYKIQSGFVITAIVVIAAVIAYQKIFKGNRLEIPGSSGDRISIAVIPFQNMTNDTTWNIWQNGIQDNLITYLSNYSDILEIRQTESINYYIKNKGLANSPITPSAAGSISQKLNASVFIYGSIKKAGSIVRINAQLFDSKTEEILKSFQIEGTSREEILPITDSLSVMVRNFLVISVMSKEMDWGFRPFISTSSSEAYRYYLYGFRAFYNKRDYPAARDWFLQAISVDSNLVVAMTMISYSYGDQEMYEEAKKWCLKAYSKRDLASFQQKLYIDLNYASYFETPREQIKYVTQLLEYDDQLPYFYYSLGLSYSKLFQYEEAIPGFEKSLATFNKWGSKPGWIQNYTHLGYAYHVTGQFKKEKRLYRKAEKDFPDDPLLIHRQIVLALTEGDSVAANEYIGKYLSLRKVDSEPESNILSELAEIYSEADIPYKAEEYYRRALLLESENPLKMNNLAYFLIDNDRNIDEGLELVNKALELSPENHEFLDCKGWGLFKQGKNKEALIILEKSWDIKPVYNHKIYLHIQDVKKAIANQGNI
jgi:tetratricopeptide (TPR) repeat protein